MSYYGARWYDAQLGRFTSAGTMVPGPANPQAFNRYAYVINNPFRFTDPTGHAPCRAGTKCLGSGGVRNGQSSSIRSKKQDARNLTPWLAKELNRYAVLPEGKRLSNLNNNRLQSVFGIFATISLKQKAFGNFIQMVQDGAPLDIKDNIQSQLGNTVQIGGRWFEYSTAGNITYGFYGVAWGFSKFELHAGAGKAQLDDYNRSPSDTPLGPWNYGYDTPDDYWAIEFGAQLY